MATEAKDLLIGAHCSAAGGVHNALLEGQKIGATTIQLFTANQKRWKNKPLSEEQIALYHDTLEETGLQEIMCHDSYLINLGCPNEENLIKSREAFSDEITRCNQLGISFLNFHPGSHLKEDPQECLDRIAESLLLYEEQISEGECRLLLEATAGQGSNLGYKFDQLGYIIEQVESRIPIGVCIDTCHIFAAGYDIRTRDGWNETLEAFDQECGLEHLYAFHLNDSMKEFGSRRDRHAPLGEGEIGIECFEFLMTDSRTRELPKYLETPGGPELWVKEIALLREMA